jgi:glycosyltransferase involved in cell wall biosynthesis
MRVLILNYQYPPLDGGAGNATAQIARQFASRNIAVDVVTAGADTKPTTPASWLGVPDVRQDDGGFNLYRVCRRNGTHQASMRGAASYLTAARPVIRRLCRTHRYDALHVFFSLPTGAVLPFVDAGDLPVVVSLRGSDVPGYDPHNRMLQRFHRLTLPLTRWIWRRADRVVAPSERLGRLALNTMPDMAYAVIHNGVDLQRFQPATPRRAPRVDRVRCLAVARLVEAKGLTDLLGALALLERGRFELEIVGTGPDEASLRRLTTQLGLDDEVRFAGALSPEQVAERYRQADLFTLAPREESFGTVFAEALASGLPVVGSRIGGTTEFVEHGRNGLLVPPRDPAALATAIQELADAPARRSEMGTTNRVKAERYLSWGRVAERYLELYDAVRRRRATELPTSAAPTVPTAPTRPKLPTGTS